MRDTKFYEFMINTKKTAVRRQFGCLFKLEILINKTLVTAINKIRFT